MSLRETIASIDARLERAEEALRHSGWKRVIDGDIQWLKEQPRCVERDHIEEILLLVRDVSPGHIKELKPKRRLHSWPLGWPLGHNVMCAREGCSTIRVHGGLYIRADGTESKTAGECTGGRVR